MNIEAQRIAIVLICGFALTDKTTFNGLPVYSRADKLYATKVAPVDMEMGIDWLPDYPNSLDDMREAETHLEVAMDDDDAMCCGNVQRYEDFLIQVLKDEDPFLGADYGDLWHASSQHKAEAFLRAWDKWEAEE